MRWLLIVAAILWAGGALAEDGPVMLPAQFLIGAMPKASAAAGLEQAQSIDGSTYTVVAPIFTGSDGNLSYLRFSNRSTATVVTPITIVGWPSGNSYGTVNVQVPAHASPQYSISEILSANNINGLQSGDQGFSLYLQGGNPSAGFSHILYDSNNGFFENLSMCIWKANTDYSGLNSWVFNVHTTQLANYPATVFIHNFSSSAATFLVDIYEARYGGYKGTISLQANANSTYGIPFSWFETQASWTPGSTEQHANLNFRVSAASQPLSAVVGQAIFNQQFNSYVNMSEMCAIN
jgi:hypothetical protein